jgi:hypothetical protein
VTHAQSMRSEYDALVDDDLVLACVDDFCRLTVRHRVRKTIAAPYSAMREGHAVSGVSACNIDSMDSCDGKQSVPKHRKVS